MGVILMSRTLEAITNAARSAALGMAVAVAGLAYGCASSLMPAYHLRDANRDGTSDLVRERFGWGPNGTRTYEFWARRGDNSDNHGTAADPSRFRAEVHGRVVLPASPDSIVYTDEDVDGDGRDDMLVVRRDPQGRIDLYVREFGHGDPLHLVVRPPTDIVVDRAIPDGASPVRY